MYISNSLFYFFLKETILSGKGRFFFFFLFFFLFMTVLCLRFCARAFCSCGKWGPLFIAVRGPLTIAASPVAEHRLQTRRLSNCGSRAQPLRGTWDPPRPGLEPMSPALTGGLPTTAPPGKPSRPLLLQSTGSRCAGSVIGAHGPSCSVACGIFPDQGSNPCPLH